MNALLVYLAIGIIIAVVDGGWLSGVHGDLEESFAVVVFWPVYLASLLILFAFAGLVQAMIWLMRGT